MGIRPDAAALIVAYRGDTIPHPTEEGRVMNSSGSARGGRRSLGHGTDRLPSVRRMSEPPSTTELLTLGAPIVLRDGSRVRLRPGRPDDRELLLRGFERLSVESRYRRFLAPVPELTEAMLRYLTSVDHHDHEAIIALDEQTGEGVGVARYVRSRQRPAVGELAVTVIDDWQGRGLGTALTDVIAARARQEGIAAFTAMMLASNQQMMSLLEHLGEVQVTDREAGTVEIEIPIPAIGLSPALRKLLRLAARHDVAVPLGAGHESSLRAVTPAGEGSASPRSPPRAPRKIVELKVLGQSASKPVRNPVAVDCFVHRPTGISGRWPWGSASRSAWEVGGALAATRSCHEYGIRALSGCRRGCLARRSNHAVD